jgi:HSP90 family molecular chaperone
VKNAIGDTTVEKVKISKSLTTENDSACNVLSPRFGWTGNMEKLMLAQPLGDTKTNSFMKGKKIVELNAVHPIVKKLIELVETDRETAVTTTKVLYHSALVGSGFPIENPVEFSRIVQSILAV